ncbi:hypothetical protein MIND_01195700 [Mycena indigotica]|uniref:MYND-type domain-containing protein n=1 Tax=Mycena indigotica TaxID=2126181 RepID=A0A8H6S675_9AGAR|nr:uncharacterized protein MIND_01195700 [Mycena indigotica]KAF7292965.1 hypothetical protein MIND_01195700 [Mycena indigotica]
MSQYSGFQAYANRGPGFSDPTPPPLLEPPPQFKPLEPISIHHNYAPSINEIHYYINYHLGQTPFLSHLPKNKVHLRYFIQYCMSARTIRRYLPAYGKTEKELECVEVESPDGRRFKIFDFYAALGFIISECELRDFKSGSSIDSIETRDAYKKILAYYIRWIAVLKPMYSDDAAPATAIIGYRGNSPSNSGSSLIISALFPTRPSEYNRALSAAYQVPAKENQNSLFGVHPEHGPLYFENKNSDNGHCCEISMLCYVLPTSAVDPVTVYGLAVDIRKASTKTKLTSEYNAVAFEDCLRGPCDNCKAMFRIINNAMRTDPSYRGGMAQAFTYYDRATQQPTGSWPDLNARHPTTASQRCINCQVRPNVETFACVCQYVAYCCAPCKSAHRAQHARMCGYYNVCWLPRCTQRLGGGVVKCKKCETVPNRLQAKYCCRDHAKEDGPSHYQWCKDVRNLVPSDTLEFQQKLKAAWGLL